MSRSTRFILGAILLLIGGVTALVLFSYGKQFAAAALYDNGLDHSKAHEYDQAITDFDKAIRLDPKKALYYRGRGSVYAHHTLKNYPKAIADFDEALRLDPNDTEARFLRGDAWFLSHNYPKALEDFNETIRNAPGNVEARYLRGITYHSQGDYSGSIPDFDEAIRLGKDKVPEALVARGDSYRRLRNYDKAIADCTEALKRNPDDFTAYFTRALTYKDSGEFDKALADYNKALRLRPNDATTLHYRGLLYVAMGEPGKALEDYNTAIRMVPDSAFALASRGQLLFNRGDYAGALDDYKKATAHDSPLGYNNYAWFLATCPDPAFRDGKQAVEYALKACAFSQWQEPFAIDTLAAAYAETGDFEKAVNFQQWCLALKPDTKGGQARLELYKAHKPDRETPETPGS